MAVILAPRLARCTSGIVLAILSLGGCVNDPGYTWPNLPKRSLWLLYQGDVGSDVDHVGGGWGSHK
jgi:hypothetical protein